MNKKKIFAIVLFIILGLFALTFANPRTTKKDQPNNNNNTNDVIDNNNNNNNTDNKDDNNKNDDKKDNVKPVVKKENTKPEIKLNGGDVILRVDEEYVELGATATDLEDGDLTDKIVISSDIKNEKGIYYVFYTIDDSEGAVETVSRKVEVVDTKDLEEDIDLGNEILDLTEDKIVSKDLQDLLDQLEETIENGNNDIDNHDSTQEVIDEDEDVIEEIIEKIKELKFKVNFLIDNKIIAEFDKLFNESVSDEEIAGINTFKPGYTFSGWTGNYKNVMKNEDVNGTQVLNTYTLSSSIIFVVNGNSTTVDREPVKFDVENPIAFIEPVKIGYDCTGYKLADGTSVTSTANMYEDTTITATCTARNDSKYTVVVNYEDEEPINVPMEGITDTVIDVNALIKEYVKVGYTLDSVTPANATISGNNDTVVTLNYVKEVYEVKFMNDGVQYGETQTVKFNGSAVAPSVNPTKDSTVDTVYTFTGWDKDFSVITEDTVVNAKYSETTRKYTVKFVNYNGTVLASDDYDYGTIPSYTGTPVKEADAQYTYTFAGWDKEVVAVTKDVTYTATFTQTVNKYTVTFYVDGRVYGNAQSVEYGKGAIAPKNPTKKNYTFAGWDKDFSNITGDLEVNATFTANQTGIRAEVKPTMMLQFQKGKTYNIKDYINVYKVFADGSEELTDDYTVTGFSTSNVTKNDRLTIKQGEYTDKSLTYSVINKEAFQTKFEVIYTDKKGYYYTNNSFCRENCDEGHNIYYKSLDYKPLEIVEHYDEIIKVTSVKVNYTNNISETLDLSDSVRWSDVDGWFNKEYYNPVYIASSTRTTKKNNKTRNADIMDSTYVISTVEIKYNREGYGDFVVYFEYNKDTNTFTAYDEAKVK